MACLSSLSACSSFSQASLSILASSRRRLRAAVRQFAISRLYLKRKYFLVEASINPKAKQKCFYYLSRLSAIFATLSSSNFFSFCTSALWVPFTSNQSLKREKSKHTKTRTFSYQRRWTFFSPSSANLSRSAACRSLVMASLIFLSAIKSVKS